MVATSSTVNLYVAGSIAIFNDGVDSVAKSVSNYSRLSSTDCLSHFNQNDWRKMHGVGLDDSDEITRADLQPQQSWESKQSAIHAINRQLNDLSRKLNHGHEICHASRLGEVFKSSIVPGERCEKFSELMSGSDYPELGEKIGDLFNLIDKLLRYRANYQGLKKQKRIKKKLVHKNEASNIIQRQRNMINQALVKVTEIIVKILQPVSDEQKAVIDALVTKNFPDLGNYMQNKIDDNIPSLRKLLGFKSGAAKALKARRSNAPTKRMIQSVASMFQAEKDEEPKVYRIYFGRGADRVFVLTAKMNGRPARDSTATFTPLDENQVFSFRQRFRATVVEQ